MKSILHPSATLTILLAALAITACQSKPDEVQAKAEPVEQVAVVEEEVVQEVAPKPEPTPAPAAPAVVKPNTSPVPPTMNQMLVDQEIPNVKFAVTSPQDGTTIDSNTVNFTFDLQNYRINKWLGQHIHVILDNEPYMAHYDASTPLVVDNLTPGTHVIRTFPARHYHLSLKKGDVFKTVIFHVKEPSKDFKFDKKKPYLTYSRPKGTYPAAAAKEGLLLDYYVSNIKIGKNAKVVYGVDGKEVTQEKWEPVILPPMEPGEHTITLKLVDRNGKLIENGGFNNTTRKIVVE